MCGRFGATFNYSKLKTLWNLRGEIPEFGPRYNIAPSQDVPVIVQNNDHNELKSMRWGLVPSWVQGRSIGQRMINARSETLLDKASFRQLVSERRCLVPASGFYEWRKEGKRKVPMWIYLKNREPFVFAGLWDRWIDRESRADLHSFTIITTRPNALLKPIHDRMPVIYDAEMGRQWLRGPFGGRRIDLDLVLQPLPSELMEAHDVSTLVNAPENDSPDCIKPLPPGYVPRGQLPLI